MMSMPLFNSAWRNAYICASTEDVYICASYVDHFLSILRPPRIIVQVEFANLDANFHSRPSPCHRNLRKCINELTLEDPPYARAKERAHARGMVLKREVSHPKADHHRLRSEDPFTSASAERSRNLPLSSLTSSNCWCVLQNPGRWA